jgi:hypothetical protein
MNQAVPKRLASSLIRRRSCQSAAGYCRAPILLDPGFAEQASNRYFDTKLDRALDREAEGLGKRSGIPRHEGVDKSLPAGHRAPCELADEPGLRQAVPSSGVESERLAAGAIEDVLDRGYLHVAIVRDDASDVGGHLLEDDPVFFANRGPACVNDRDDHDVVVEHVRREPIVMQDEGDSFAVRREKDRGFGTPACGATGPLFALVRVERRRELCEPRRPVGVPIPR